MTQKEIAAKAGVSVATVSYVLNGSKKVSKETRERVLGIIKETGYRSNLLASSLRRSHTGLLGILVEDITTTHIPAILDGINKVTEEAGYRTILSNLRLVSKIGYQFQQITEYRDEIDRAVDTMLQMSVDGIIYAGMHDRPIRDVLHRLNRPIVYCYCYTDNGGSSVHYSNERAAYELAQLFLKKGHRSFAVLKGAPGSEPSILRLKGIQRALEEDGIVLQEKDVLEADYNYEKAKEVSLQIFREEDHPTAVIALNDDMALGCRDAALEAGLSVPEDVSISGFDNAEIIRYARPGITTVERPLHDMGARAAGLLLEKIQNKAEEDVNITLPCKIIERESIRDLRSN